MTIDELRDLVMARGAEIRDRVASIQAAVDAFAPGEPPPPPPPPPPPDPPPPPPPPADPPEGDGPRPGFHEVQSGFWDGWFVDELRNFTDDPAQSAGFMNHNAQGFYHLGLGKKGYAEFEVYADTTEPPGDPGGGQHLFSISSGPGGGRGWLRPDFGIRPQNFRIDVYNTNQAGEAWNGRRWATSQRIAFDFWRKWTKLRVEWEQAGAILRMRTVIAGARTNDYRFPIFPDSNEVGRWLVVGNMDEAGGTHGKIGYRAWQWGTLP